MKLKILTKNPENVVVGFIGKTGIFRIKKRDLLKLGISKIDRWFFSFDLDEGAVKKHIYLLRVNINSNDDNNNTYLGKKMTFTQAGVYLDINMLISETKIKTPTKCFIEQFVESEHQGLRIKLV